MAPLYYLVVPEYVLIRPQEIRGVAPDFHVPKRHRETPTTAKDVKDNPNIFKAEVPSNLSSSLGQPSRLAVV